MFTQHELNNQLEEPNMVTNYLRQCHLVSLVIANHYEPQEPSHIRIDYSNSSLINYQTFSVAKYMCTLLHITILM